MPWRLVLACLLLSACGDDDEDAGTGGAGGEAGTSGRGGQSGSPHAGAGAGHSGSGGAGGRAQTGGGGGGASGANGGRGGNGPSGGHAANGGHSGGGGAGADAGYGMIKLRPNIVAGTETPIAPLQIGVVTEASLLSLKYYVTSIQLCEDLELQGSGFSNASGCIQLYQNQPAGSPNYDTYTVDEAQADTTPGRYIDLMTAEGRAALSTPVNVRVPIAEPATSQNDVDVDSDAGVTDPPRRAGVYRFGLINFYRPIKVTAELPIIGEPGKQFRTRAVTDILETPGLNGGLGNERVLIGDTLSDAAPEETTYMLNNGGALFVFQTPFEITQADIDAEAEIKIDLVFNPDHFGQAYTLQDCDTQPWATICDPTNDVVIDMPFVRMSPVPRKSGEATHKETYLLDYEEHAKLRIELYYNASDEQAGIQGVDTAIVYDELATLPSNKTIASNFVAQTGSVTTDNADVTLFDYRHMPNLEGLRRRDDGTVTIHCLFTGSLCPTLGGEVTRAYTYEGDSLVSTD